MKARIYISGAGIGIPGTGFGANIGVSAYVEIGSSSESGKKRVYGVADTFSLGTNSSTLLAGFVKTEWFPLGSDGLKLLQLDYLSGKLMQVELKGTLVSQGRVDVQILLIDSEGAGETVLERFSIPATGGQLDTTRVRGSIRLMPVRPAQGVH